MNKCWYCGKEIENENDKEHIGICDKCYEESFEVGNKFVSNLIEKQTDKDQKIADLEAKLAESESEVDRYKNWHDDVVERNKQLKQELTENIILLEGLRKFEEEKKDIAMKRVYELKQQLAEKEKERELDNAFWKQECDSLQKALDESENKIDKLEDKLHHYYEETLNNGTCGLCEHLRGEYKTDFAIEQLKQTKKLIKEKYTYDVEESDWAVVYELDIDEIFDQQIASLREKK